MSRLISFLAGEENIREECGAGTFLLKVIYPF
jgi:hypothetical protein